MTSASELLEAYASADCDRDAAAFLDRLFAEHIRAWCAEAARRTLRNYGIRGMDQTDEEAEVAAEVMLQMTARILEIRGGGAPLIGNLRAYAVTAVYNSCFARIRARCPRHVQLQNRIRYLLRNDDHFALWMSTNGEHLAGLSAWNAREDHVAAPVLQRSGESLKEQLKNVFHVTRAPVRLSDLIGVTADSLGIVESGSPGTEPDDEYSSGQPSADRVMIERESLTILWNEVLQLPRTQRVALLLNLRDAGGHGVIELIPATGTATFDQLAEALSLTAESLAALWHDLPLEDARIAEMLDLTRQQVINLRKSARDRLARRQRKADGNTGTNFPSAPAGKGVAARVGEKIRSVFYRQEGI